MYNDIPLSIVATHIRRVVIGNGCGGRETASFFATSLALWRERKGGIGLTDPRGVEFTFVCEAGASVWSASADAVKELPTVDIGCRSAVSLSRRMSDPMSELLKIEPSSLGVGMYQKDISASDTRKGSGRQLRALCWRGCQHRWRSLAAGLQFC